MSYIEPTSGKFTCDGVGCHTETEGQPYQEEWLSLELTDHGRREEAVEVGNEWHFCSRECLSSFLRLGEVLVDKLMNGEYS